MERTSFILVLAASLILPSPSILAGKKMNKCIDPKGNITFTTQGCTANESKKRIYVPNAQASISSLRPGEIQKLGNNHFKIAAQHRSTQSNNKKHLSWGERQALKNAKTGQQSPNKIKRVKRCNKQ